MSNVSRVLGEVEEALNRFAQQTAADNSALSIEFKNFNKRRVDDFIHEPFDNFKQKEELKEKARVQRRSRDDARTDIAGKVYSFIMMLRR